MGEQFLGLVVKTLEIYNIILVVRAIFSWLPSLHHSTIFYILCAITDPYINMFRFKRLSRIGQLDLSFLWAVMFIQFLLLAVKQASSGDGISLLWILFVFLSFISSIIQFVFVLLFVVIIVRLILYRSISPRAYHANSVLDSILNPLVGFWRNAVVKSKFIPHRTTLIYILLLLCVFWFIWRYVIQLLLRMLYALQ